MNKQMRIILALTTVICLVMMISCFFRYQHLGTELTDLDRQLLTSRETWESIASKKEELQKELNEKRNELKEAELTLSEATERSSELEAEIETLRQNILELQNIISRQD